MKKLLLLLSIAIMCLPLMAEQRTVNDAQIVASSYLRTKAQSHLLGVSAQSPELSLAMTALMFAARAASRIRRMRVRSSS